MNIPSCPVSRCLAQLPVRRGASTVAGFLCVAASLIIGFPMAIAGEAYVSLTGGHVPPFTNWADAATNIQDAVDAASPGDNVIVSNGIYQVGGRVMFGAMTNRVVLTNEVTLLSLNGPQATLIVGGNQMRGVYLGSNSTLSGFTVTNGIARNTGDVIKEQSGCGIWSETGGVVSNCLVIGNRGDGSQSFGGGVYGGSVLDTVIQGNGIRGGGGGAAVSSLVNCLVASNNFSIGGYANGGGVYQCVVSNSTLLANGKLYGVSAGGAYQSTLYGCSLLTNYSTYGAGGAQFSMLYDCVVTGNEGSSGGGTWNCTNSDSIITGNVANGDGGGVYLGASYRCKILNNVAGGRGGGAYQGSLYNCLVAGNSVDSSLGVPYGSGGGAFGSLLHNCTLTRNIANNSGGGIFGGQCYNSIVYGNSAPMFSNWTNSLMSLSCTTPLTGLSGSGNISAPPEFVDEEGGVFKLKCGSACIDAGFQYFYYTNSIYTNDVDGLTRPLDGDGDSLAKFDMGAFEYDPTADLTPAIRAVRGFSPLVTSYPETYFAQIPGCADYYWWNFGDGIVVSNQASPSHAWQLPGQYQLTLSAHYPSLGQILSVTSVVEVIQQPVYYVNASNTTPAAPYTNWNTAAQKIQQAVAAGSTPGRLVLVTNGVYRDNGVAVNGTILNSVVLTNPVMVQSVNGPEATVIWPTTNPRRPAFVGSNAFLIGFTLTNGVTLSTGDTNIDQSGGGAWCQPGGVISNCVITGNRATMNGGGAFGGTFYNCVLTNNQFGSAVAQGGGVYGGTLYDSLVVSNKAFGTSTGRAGSGVAQSTLHGCTVIGNTGSQFGGGAYMGSLYGCVLSGNQATYGAGVYSNELWNCVLEGNIASQQGGGSYYATLFNCALKKNQAGSSGGGGYGGSFTHCTIVSNSAVSVGGIAASGLTVSSNSIVYYNSGVNLSGVQARYTCSTPLPSGTGNLTNAPMFMDLAAGDLRLRFGSPCIDTAANLTSLVPTDIEGKTRPLDGNGDGVAASDMGAYEFDLLSTVGTNWLTSRGLDPNDPLVFATDADGDTFSTLAEWVADTDPTNAGSFFLIDGITNVAPVEVVFQSSSNRAYTLLAADMPPTNGWVPVGGAIAIPGTGSLARLADTNIADMKVYRVQVTVP